MPQPDYEDDLVFKPIKIVSLTDDWKANRLCYGKSYWCCGENGQIEICTLGCNNKFYSGDYELEGIEEVLAICDYEELLRLNQEIDSQQQTNQAMGKKLVKIFNLLKECKKELTDISTMACYPDTNLTQQADFDSLFNKCEDILSRVNAAIGKEE